MSDKNLREAVRKLIKKEVSKNPEITQEGIVSGILGTIEKALKRANNKRFEKSLESLAKSGPEGKKAADHLVKSLKNAESYMDDANDMLTKLGWEN